MAEPWNRRLRLLSPAPSPLSLWPSRGMRIRRNPIISDPLKSTRLRMRSYAKCRSQSPKVDAPSAPNPNLARPHHLSDTKRHRPRRRHPRNETQCRPPRLQPEPSKRRHPPRLRLCARGIPHAALAARGTNAASSGEADLELLIRGEEHAVTHHYARSGRNTWANNEQSNETPVGVLVAGELACISVPACTYDIRQ